MGQTCSIRRELINMYKICQKIFSKTPFRIPATGLIRKVILNGCYRNRVRCRLGSTGP